MFRILAICFLTIIFSTSAWADEKSDKIKTLMETQGLLSAFEQQLEMGKVQNKKMGEQVIEQIMTQLNPNPEFKARFTSAFQGFIKKVSNQYTADQIVEVWAKYYGKEFSNEELDQLIEFYTSKIGKKEIEASKIALVNFTNHFQKLNEPFLKNVMQEYITELKLVAKECNCAK